MTPDRNSDINSDMPQGMAKHNADGLVPCAAFDHALPTYLTGQLSDEDAVQVESHAASCVRCEALLEESTRVPTSNFLPPLPSTLRAPIMTAVAASSHPGASPVFSDRARSSVHRFHAPHAAWRWPIGTAAATLLAAAALFIFVRPQRKPDVPAPSRVSVTMPGVNAYPDNAAMGNLARLASDRARAEFLLLDAAAREIDDALQASPDDAELRGYQSVVGARRSELTQRVKEATS